MPGLLAAACGLLLTFALPPLGWWPFLLAFAPFLVLVARAKGARAAFWLGAAFALPFFALHILWLPRSFAELFGPAFWVVYPFLLAILATFWGLTSWGAWVLARLTGGATAAARPVRVLVYLPLLWVLVEWARTQGYFAFPWGTLGYAWLETPVAQLAEFGGVYGLSLLAVLLAAVLALPWSGPLPPRAPTVAAAVATAGLLVTGAFLAGGALLAGAPVATGEAGPATTYRALLVQGDVEPFARVFSAAHDLGVHLALTEAGVSAAEAEGAPPFDLVVWPEGAVMGYDLTAGDGGPLRSAITDAAPSATFIVGGRVHEGGQGFNSLLALRRGALVGRYDKHYLVPFGERWPFYEALNGVYAAVFHAFRLPLLATTTAGRVMEPLPAGEFAVGAFVCYESVFPQVQRELVARGAQVLVLGTNDAWFGVGAGAVQHFDMGRLRAVETRRWLLRAGNDGITAFIDPWGRVTGRAERGVPTTLAGGFDSHTELTFWVRHGQYAPMLLAAALLAAAAAWLLQARRRGRA